MHSHLTTPGIKSPIILSVTLALLILLLFRGSLLSNDNQIHIDIENDPRMLAVNPFTNRAVVTHWHSNSISIVDLNTEHVLKKLRVERLPKGVAIDTDMNIAVITYQAKRSVTLIDLNSNQVVAGIHVDNFAGNIAINSVTHIAAITSRTDFHVIFLDLVQKKVVAKTLVGPGSGDVAIDPVRNMTLVLSPVTKHLKIIDMNNYTVSDSIHLEKRPQAIDVNPETQTALITNYRDHSVTEIDLLNRRSFTMPVLRYPLDVAFNTIDNRAVVLCDHDRKLLLLDLNTNKIINAYSLPRHPKSVAVNSIKNIAIVADDARDDLTIIPLPASPSLPKIKITSPLDNAQIFSNTVSVSGTVENSTNVTVNDLTASVSGNTFSATLTLKAGKNTISATATDKYGRTTCHDILVDILTGKITGTVTNSITGWLLPFVMVSITDAKGNMQTIATTSSGTYTADIASGAYTGTVTKPWYFSYSFSGTVITGETSVINIPLNPSPPTITMNSITVTDITENSAKINWTTDQITAGSVEYGKTTAYGAIVSNSIEETTHSITLTNLTSSTTYHFRVNATSGNGTSVVSNDITFKTRGHIDVIINSPASGASINGNSITVTGSMANTANIETGVTINGIPAALINNQFSINNISLTGGQNTISITATDAEGTTKSQTITVNASIPADYIKLSAYSESGTAPMEVTLRINGTFSITSPTITPTGPGTVEQLADDNPDVFKYKITTEGIYYFSVQATGPDSNTYTDTIAITVLPLVQVDTLLKAKWTAFSDALKTKDIITALNMMLPRSRARYEAIYSLLKDQLPTIMAANTGLVLQSVTGDRAYYELYTMEDGEIFAYRLSFMKDANGLWLIREF
jgi:YVTN family beta-propeller protein